MLDNGIVLITMFKNEVKNITRFLESSYRYVNCFIFQDNGSTDGTPETIHQFLKDKNISYFIYKLDEGWKSFGWNRNHLMQTTLNYEHGCDWILSMDCDEVLQVKENFDWNIFKDTSIQCFDVAAEYGNNIYYRCRIYNAKLPWKYRDDKAHEVIYVDDPNIMYQYTSFSLPVGFKQIGYPEGESYSIKTKYLTDALLLEERLNREDTLLTDTYHFWYIGKSYHDAMFNSDLPLGKNQQLEYSRRSTFYFKEFVNFVHNYNNTGRADRIDEMSYYAMFLIGHNYKFANDVDNAIKYFNAAGEFAPPRNEHLVALAQLYYDIGNYKKSLKFLNEALDSSRLNPFPAYNFVIDKSCYLDTSDYLLQLKNTIINKDESLKSSFILPNIDMYKLALSNNRKKRIFVIDNFYDNPDIIREYALGVEFSPDIRYYKGMRSTQQHIFKGTKEAFEEIMGEKIVNFEEHGMCGRFQICTAEDPLVYHYDQQKWAAMIYLSPDAPFDCGTSLLAHKESKIRGADDPNSDLAFTGGFFDKTKFEVIDTVGSVYNRLVIFDSRCIHAACQYFGNSKETGRLTHLFFFD